MGTVELTYVIRFLNGPRVELIRTGLEMTRTLASGEASAAALARSRTIEALVLKRSESVSVGPLRS